MYVAIYKLGQKMNSNFCANLAGFCMDSHILYISTKNIAILYCSNCIHQTHSPCPWFVTNKPLALHIQGSLVANLTCDLIQIYLTIVLTWGVKKVRQTGLISAEAKKLLSLNDIK